MRKEVIDKLEFMDYAPVVFISAKTGQRVERLFELVDLFLIRHLFVFKPECSMMYLTKP